MAVYNPLLTSTKTSDSRVSVQVHPLVLLTVSDYITRHILRQQQGPIVGVIIGAQHGRDITMEHAFECKTLVDRDGDVVLDPQWFAARLQQYKDVHKEPPLDLVGWFTTCPPSGPQPRHLPIHHQLLDQYNEPCLLLAFHADLAAQGASAGGKLPLTIYESLMENAFGEDKPMADGSGAGSQTSIRFQEVPYTIETGEAEMIAVDTVAKGGANAASRPAAPAGSSDADTKGKKRAAGEGPVEAATGGTADQDFLTPEDDDKIAALTAKANAVRMLQQRISLISKYLESVPACYLNDAEKGSRMDAEPAVQHTVLRSIAALLARLPLLAPSTPAHQQGGLSESQFGREVAGEASDVALVSLLGHVGGVLDAAQRLGQKAAAIEANRQTQNKYAGAAGAGQRFAVEPPGGLMDDEGDEGIDATMTY